MDREQADASGMCRYKLISGVISFQYFRFAMSQCLRGETHAVKSLTPTAHPS